MMTGVLFAFDDARQRVRSPRGFEKVQQIVEGDEVLKRNEHDNPLAEWRVRFVPRIQPFVTRR